MQCVASGGSVDCGRLVGGEAGWQGLVKQGKWAEEPRLTRDCLFCSCNSQMFVANKAGIWVAP